MDHTIVHFEIPAEDPERAAQFYRELFGWAIKKWQAPAEGPDAVGGMEYWTINTVPSDQHGQLVRPGVNGGLMRRKHPQQPFATYISVESVSDYLDRAVELGGQIALPKMPVPGMGWFGYFKDPEGNIFGVWENDPNAA
jgi:predicted enzyme related to lactoylglutathione lyase